MISRFMIKFFFFSKPNYFAIVGYNAEDHSLVSIVTARYTNFRKFNFNTFRVIYPKTKTGYIMTIGVKSEYRKLGLGKEILKRAIFHLWKADCKRVRLHVKASNEPAISFYKKFGFVANNLIERYYTNINGESHHAYEMIFEYPKKYKNGRKNRI